MSRSNRRAARDRHVRTANNSRVRPFVWAAIAWILAFLLGVVSRAMQFKSADDYLSEVQNHAAANRMIEAEAALRKLVARNSDRVDARLLLAKLAHDRRDWPTVAAAFRAIPDSDPAAGAIRVAEGDAWINLGRAREAEDCWTRAYRLAPDELQPRYRLIYLYGLQLRRDLWRKLLWELYDRRHAGQREMIQLLIAGDVVWEPEEALRSVQQFADSDPSDHNSRRAVGEYLLLAGRIPQAMSELESIVQEASDNLEARVVLAECHLAVGDASVAGRYLDQAPSDDRHRARYWKGQGTLAFMERRYAEASAAFQEALRIFPYDRELHHKRSQVLRMLGELELAGRHAHIAGTLARIHRLCHSIHGERELNMSRVHQIVLLCEELKLIEEARGWTDFGLEHDPQDSLLRNLQDRLQTLPATSMRNPPSLGELL